MVAPGGDGPSRERGSGRLRVLYVIGNLQMGGTESHLVQLMTRVARERVEPRLLMLKGVNDLMSEELARELSPVILEVGPGSRGTVEAMARMRGAIRRIAPHIVHAYGYPADCLAALSAVGLRGVRVITTRRGNEERPRRHRYYRWSNRVVDVVACVSHAAAAHAAATEGLAAAKTVVIPNGIDLERYQPSPRSSGPIETIGTVLRLRQIKGIDLLLEAYALLPAPRPALRIAGPADTSYGEELVARYAGTPGITFLGEVMDVPGFLRELDLFVLPSRSEGMSNALLEALAMGLPIVATGVGGNVEVLAEGAAGVVVPPSAPGIAGGIRELIEDPSRAREFGRRARSRAETEYAITTMVRRHEELYARLVVGMR